MAANVENMFSVRETPWHGLGTVIQEALTSKEAIGIAGLDWTVEQIPLIHKEQDSGYFMNVRSSDEKVLGVVGGRYKPVQNVEAFDFTDDLIGQGVKYETAGSLSNGKRIWMLAKMPETDILGDKVEPFMCLTNCHDGFGSLKVCMTPVRVVCQNTLNLALDSAKRMWSVRHTGSIGAKLSEARRTFDLAGTYVDSLKEQAEKLAAIKVAPKDFDMLAETMFPVTGEMTSRKEDSQLLLQEQLRQAWNMDDLGNIKGTAWGFINAVSDMATHKKPGRKTDNSQENSFMYTIDAPVILDAALKLILQSRMSV